LRSLEELAKKARELKDKGLSTYEIADELKVQADTVVWLLVHKDAGERGAAAPKPKDTFDVYVNWNSIGSSAHRLALIGEAMADNVREAVGSGVMEEPEVVAGIEGGAMTLCLVVAKTLGKPMAMVRPQRVGEKKIAGAVNTSFSPVEGKKVLIVDTIVRLGETIRAAMETLEAVRAKAVGITVLANKSGRENIEGVPLRSLVELLPVSRQ